MYQAEVKRKKLKVKFNNISDYLSTLNMKSYFHTLKDIQAINEAYAMYSNDYSWAGIYYPDIDKRRDVFNKSFFKFDFYTYPFVTELKISFSVTMPINNGLKVSREIDNNPIQQDVRKIAKETGVNFTLDVTLNRDQKITNVFSGDLIDSHNIACDFARKTAMVEVDKPYDIVITSNSGYPLDQNLYQTVKGLSAASQIVRKGGEILCLSECSDGIPSHGKFYSLLSEFNQPDQVEDVLADPNFHCQDQWQVQILSQIAKKANVNLYTEGLSDDEIRNAFMISVQNPQNFLNQKILSNKNLRGCVLPEGPITIPFFN